MRRHPGFALSGALTLLLAATGSAWADEAAPATAGGPGAVNVYANRTRLT